MLSRRELIGKTAVGAGAAALTLGAVGAAVASTGDGQAAAGTLPGERSGMLPSDPTGKLPTDPSAKLPTDPTVILPEDRIGRDTVAPEASAALPAPWELVSPLAAGSPIAHGWRLADLGPVRDGSCVVTLQNERGRSRRIHLCRNDGDPQGIVYTRRVDLVVMNEGHGDLPTEENLAQAVAQLAHTIAANERRAPGPIFTELLPHAERLTRFASAGEPWADGKLR